MNTLRDMHLSLAGRWRPEDAAHALLNCQEVAAALTPKARSALGKAIPGWYRGTTSMSREFQSADGLDRMLKVARDLFPDIAGPTSDADPEQILAFIDRCKASLHLEVGVLIDFKASRLSRADRIAQKVTASHFSYNKRVRLLLRMEAKLSKYREQIILRGLARTAQTRLASCIPWEDFSSDLPTAAFVTYFTARSGLRSTFTNKSQVRAFDEVCDALYSVLTSKKAPTNWYAVALVYPMKEVIDRLTDEQKGRLLGLWFEQMKTAAVVIDGLQEAGHYNLQTLAVHRGNDSSTWNEAAGAFNKCRDGWIATLYALGMETMLDHLAPGKMMRLMAADVMRWHIYSKAVAAGVKMDYHRFDWNNIPEVALEPDTLVWRDLPKPWEVVLGKTPCTRSMIEAACAARGIEGKGWVHPRSKTVAKFTPTPELVHGVVISSPVLATTLKALGYFSGPSKGLKGPPTVAITKTEVEGTVVVTEADTKPLSTLIAGMLGEPPELEPLV